MAMSTDGTMSIVRTATSSLVKKVSLNSFIKNRQEKFKHKTIAYEVIIRIQEQKKLHLSDAWPTLKTRTEQCSSFGICKPFLYIYFLIITLCRSDSQKRHKMVWQSNSCLPDNWLEFFTTRQWELYAMLGGRRVYRVGVSRL